MTWPQAVAADIPKGYRSEVTDNLVRFAYQNVYFQDVIKPLHESVEPMVLNTKDLTYVPKVDFPLHLIPQMKLAISRSLPPRCGMPRKTSGSLS